MPPGAEPPTDPKGIPERLGPYRVDGLWHADDVGIVLDGHGPQGRAEIVLLGAAPATDPTARARFTAAAAELQRAEPDSGSPTVLHSNTQGAVPWVAISPGSGPQGAQPLLAPVWPDVIDDDVRGPVYVPHWRGMPSAYPSRPLPLGRTPVPWWWWLVGFLVALILAVILGLLLRSCLPPPQETSPTGTGTGTQSGSPTSGTGSSSPTSGTESPTQSESGSGSESPTSPSDDGSTEASPTDTQTAPGDDQTGEGTLPPNPRRSW